MGMSKGKTPRIFPMVAATLVNKKMLIKINDLRALFLQTAQLLQSRLGMPLGRTIYRIPFSRRTPTTLNNLRL